MFITVTGQSIVAAWAMITHPEHIEHVTGGRGRAAEPIRWQDRPIERHVLHLPRSEVINAIMLEGSPYSTVDCGLH